jgi:hypothetical protein
MRLWLTMRVCFGERQNLNAIPYFVRPARSLARRRWRVTRPSSKGPASLTSHLGATIDVEYKFIRNLWDCGGGSRRVHGLVPVPSIQRWTIFQHVGVLVYVFEVRAHDMAVFLLVHKMDLVTGGDRARRCWSTGRASCKWRVQPCPSCSVRASTTRRRTRYDTVSTCLACYEIHAATSSSQ